MRPMDRVRRPSLGSSSPSTAPIDMQPPSDSQILPPHTSQTSRGMPNIEDYCMGKPQKINASHFGAVELSVCLQENALFLPARTASSRSHRNGSRHHRRGHDDSTSPPPPDDQHADPPHRNSGSSNHNTTNNQSHERAEAVAISNPHEMTPEATLFTDADIDAPDDAPPPGIEDDDASCCATPGATLRGSVLLKLSKPTKIKEIGVSFYCVSRTVWNLVPQPNVLVDTPLPSSAEVEDVAYLGIHHWHFVPLKEFGAASASYNHSNTANEQSATLIGQDLFGADTAIFKDSPNEVHHRKLGRILHNSTCRVRGRAPHQIPVFSPMTSQPRKLRQPNVQSDGVQFPAGEYVFHFSIIVDASTPETVFAPNGHVRFFVSPRVVRSGPFAPNLQGRVEVDVVRSPPEATDSLGNDHVQLCRVWDERLVYSVNLERRYLTLGTSAKLLLTLLPIPGGQVEVHQVRAYLMEVVSYLYSLDATVRTSDSSLRLLLFQQNAPQETLPSGEVRTGSLLHPTEPTELRCDLQTATRSTKQVQELPQAYGRGRFGEKRYLQPDVRGPYIRVKHRLVVILRVSRLNDDGQTRSHFEVKIDTPVVILSKYCVTESVHLPMYGTDTVPEDGPPSFDDALTHELVGKPGIVPGVALLDKPPR